MRSRTYSHKLLTRMTETCAVRLLSIAALQMIGQRKIELHWNADNSGNDGPDDSQFLEVAIARAASDPAPL